MKNLWQSCFIISEIVPFYLRCQKVYLIFAIKTNNFFPFQAIYNVLVSALFCILAWAVYYVVLIVLEPFLVPLFWAVLTGFVIHPYKTRLSEFLRQWICSLENKNEPAFLAISGDLLRTIDWSCESIGSKIFSKWKIVILIAIALPIYHFVTFYPLDVLTPGLIAKFWHTFKFVEFVTLPLMVSSAMAYVLSVLILWSEERKQIFQLCGCLVWSLFGLYVINLFWPPLWMMSFVGIIVYSFNKISRFLDDDGNDEGQDVVDFRSKRMRFRQAVITVLNRMNSSQYVPGKNDFALFQQNWKHVWGAISSIYMCTFGW